jgi:hypothetical protein
MRDHPWRLREPGQLITEVLAEYQVDDGDAVVACVRDASSEQMYVGAVHVSASRWRSLDRYDQSTFLGETAQQLPIPEWQPGPPNHSIVTVLARSGYAVSGRVEGEWAVAWLYSNHLTHAYLGDLILITEFGWTELGGRRGAHLPALSD